MAVKFGALPETVFSDGATLVLTCVLPLQDDELAYVYSSCDYNQPPVTLMPSVHGLLLFTPIVVLKPDNGSYTTMSTDEWLDYTQKDDVNTKIRDNLSIKFTTEHPDPEPPSDDDDAQDNYSESGIFSGSDVEGVVEDDCCSIKDDDEILHLDI